MAPTQSPSSSRLLREGHYPYPDENVFLVTGVSIAKNTAPDFSMAGMVIASRRADLAIDYFKDVSPDPDAWASVGCLSLAQIRAMVAQIDEVGSGAPTLREGLLTFGKKQPWAIVCARDDAALLVDVVVAASPRVVCAHAEKSGATVLGFAPREALVAAIAQMEKTKSGESKKEKYASDIASGELNEHLEEIASGFSKQKRDAFEDDMREALEARRCPTASRENTRENRQSQRFR